MIIQNQNDISFIEEHLPKELYLSVSRDNLAMVMHREATKSKALDEIARVWGIERTEIVAFGDDLNDVDLLVYAGIGVATGNALNEAKTAADYICDTNDNDGVTKWIEENVL